MFAFYISRQKMHLFLPPSRYFTYFPPFPPPPKARECLNFRGYYVALFFKNSVRIAVKSRFARISKKRIRIAAVTSRIALFLEQNSNAILTLCCSTRAPKWILVLFLEQNLKMIARGCQKKATNSAPQTHRQTHRFMLFFGTLLLSFSKESMCLWSRICCILFSVASLWHPSW